MIKKNDNEKTKRGGFTLIELLIVIALLGALAVGLLAALDPFEQLKKGTDTGTRNTVSELHGAIIRYYSIKNSMPWGTNTINTPIDLSSAWTNYSLNQIVTAGELKQDFTALAGGQLTNILLMGNTESVTVCFKPLSRSMRNDPNTRYDQDNFSEYSDTSRCGDPGSPQFRCLWCVK